MKYDPNKHHRHLIRLRNGNYAIGTYFITVCLNQRIPRNFTKNTYLDFSTFGRVENDVMILNDAGKIVQQIWNEIPQQYKGVKIGEFIIMPDHIHGIIEITNDHGNTIQCVKKQNDPSRRGAIYRDQQQCDPENIQSSHVPHTQQQSKSDYVKQNYGVYEKYDNGKIEEGGEYQECKGKGKGVEYDGYGKRDWECEGDEGEEWKEEEEMEEEGMEEEGKDAINRVPTAVLSAPIGVNSGGFAGVKNPMFHINLARIVRWFKGRITFECHKINCDFKWQRNYYEHIIRNEQAYKNISRYIVNNPRNWQKDKFYRQGEK